MKTFNKIVIGKINITKILFVCVSLLKIPAAILTMISSNSKAKRMSTIKKQN